MQTVSTLSAQGQTCLFGLVNVFTPTGLGAVNGTITPLFSTPIPITQVVGPTGGLTSLNQVNGQFAVVCGRFTLSGNQVQLLVNTVIPINLGSLLGLGGGI
ncbi:MAG: hypothetical protein ACM3XM_17115 [Mycobacterium leprae]